MTRREFDTVKVESSILQKFIDTTLIDPKWRWQYRTTFGPYMTEESFKVVVEAVSDWLAGWIECPVCKGEGKITVEAYYRYTVCYLCGGSKKIQRVKHPDYWRESK